MLRLKMTIVLQLLNNIGLENVYPTGIYLAIDCYINKGVFGVLKVSESTNTN